MNTNKRMQGEYDFFSHQPYLENNTKYSFFRPAENSMLKGIIWEAYQVDDFDSTKHIALPDICADVMTLYTDDKSYCYFMGGTEDARSMKDLDFIDDVKTICGFKFCPGALGNIFTEDLCDAAGTTIEAENILHKGRAITTALGIAETFADRLRIFDSYITNRLNHGYEVDNMASYVTRRIMETHGTIRMSDLSNETGYTDRYVRKVMHQKLGMSMKAFSQVVQMQWAYHLNKEVLKSENLASLAQMCGYYDQSHMNATYKKFTGMLPKEVFSLYAH